MLGQLADSPSVDGRALPRHRPVPEKLTAAKEYKKCVGITLHK
jgi:hypothetical protein